MLYTIVEHAPCSTPLGVLSKIIIILAYSVFINEKTWISIYEWINLKELQIFSNSK